MRLNTTLVLLLSFSIAAFAGDLPKKPGTNEKGNKAEVCTDLDGRPEACPPTSDQLGSSPDETSSPTALRALPRNLLRDQQKIWTGPTRLREKDLNWLFPFAAATSGLIASDTAIEKHLPDSPTFVRRSRDASNFGAAALVGTAGSLYLWGEFTHNQHLSETGLLSGEALANTLLTVEAIKYAAGRNRPYESNGKGEFWRGGDSFPSEHAAAAWSVATVLAHEYPGTMTKVLAYGVAAGVTATRVTGGKHFASDAVIGSALGWYIGRTVYQRHEDDFDRTRFGTFDAGDRGVRPPENMGSPYVPLDSWVYPAFDRLAALGYVRSGFAGMRPWTRLECARLLEEAGGLLSDSAPGAAPEANRLYAALTAEFSSDLERRNGGRNLAAGIESVYTRFTNISGTPVTDGYHFGQTIINDFGRPYAEGANLIAGVSGGATAGPLVFYVRGEYQQAPSIPALSDRARGVIAQVDGNPVLPAAVTPAVQRFQLVDAYAGINLHNTQITVGPQTLWWAPNESGALLFSDNGGPVNMVKINQVSPFKLPGFLGRMGPWRHEFFFGKLDGHHYPANPYIYGQKLSFKPTPNLELGFSRTAVIGGVGHPLTLRRFWTSFSSVGADVTQENLLANDPGDRRGAFNLSYRVPGLRKWLALNVDSLVDDDPSPLAAPRRAAIAPGIYMPAIPKLPKLDLRLEAVYTDVPAGRSVNGQFIYWNVVYRDSYTQNGALLGSWVGREGQGYSATSTYWLSARNTLQFGYRNARVDGDFLPGGATLHDAILGADLTLRPGLSLKPRLQYEHLNFPVLAINQRSNFTASVQVTYWPTFKVK